MFSIAHFFSVGVEMPSTTCGICQSFLTSSSFASPGDVEWANAFFGFRLNRMRLWRPLVSDLCDPAQLSACNQHRRCGNPCSIFTTNHNANENAKYFWHWKSFLKHCSSPAHQPSQFMHADIQYLHCKSRKIQIHSELTPWLIEVVLQCLSELKRTRLHRLTKVLMVHP